MSDMEADDAPATSVAMPPSADDAPARASATPSVVETAFAITNTAKTTAETLLSITAPVPLVEKSDEDDDVEELCVGVPRESDKYPGTQPCKNALPPKGHRGRYQLCLSCQNLRRQYKYRNANALRRKMKRKANRKGKAVSNPAKRALLDSKHVSCQTDQVLLQKVGHGRMY